VNTPTALASGRPLRHRRTTAATATAVVATVGIATVCWLVTVQRMHGMDMGVATRLGSFPFFVSVWVPMMAAMMLPGTAPAALRLAHAGLRALSISRFVVSYVVVWALVGSVVFALYRPHSTVAAGVVALSAGLYELTPVKRGFRESCRTMVPTGWGLGLCCVGSSIGLMLLLVALGAMSLAWMAVVTGIVIAQKLLPPRALVDVPIALAIVSLGVAILVAPSHLPGLLPTMQHMNHM
jgi:predicted metal-binding membrane protein